MEVFVQNCNSLEMNGRFLIILLSLVTLCQSKKHFRFLSAKCGTSKKTAVNASCFLKSYTRKNPVLSGGLTLLRIVPDGLVFKFDCFSITSDNFKIWIRCTSKLNIH